MAKKTRVRISKRDLIRWAREDAKLALAKARNDIARIEQWLMHTDANGGILEQPRSRYGHPIGNPEPRKKRRMSRRKAGK